MNSEANGQLKNVHRCDHSLNLYTILRPAFFDDVLARVHFL